MASRGELRVLLGYEATPGLAVTPDTKWAGLATLHNVLDRQFPDEARGKISRNVRDHVVQKRSEGTLSSEAATYEQIVIPLAMTINDVTPGGGPVYTWTFDPDLDDVIDPATFTMQRGIASKGYEANYVLGNSLKIAGEAAGAWSVECSWLGGEVTASGISMAIVAGEPDLTPILTGNTRLYIDDSWATLGNTTISGYLINFDWSLAGYHQKQFIDGVLYPTSHGLDKRSATLTLTAEWETARELVEEAAYEAGTARFIRLQATTGTNVARIDGCYKITDVAPLDNRDGNVTVVYSLESEYDATSEEEYQVYIANSVDSL